MFGGDANSGRGLWCVLGMVATSGACGPAAPSDAHVHDRSLGVSVAEVPRAGRGGPRPWLAVAVTRDAARLDDEGFARAQRDANAHRLAQMSMFERIKSGFEDPDPAWIPVPGQDGAPISLSDNQDYLVPALYERLADARYAQGHWSERVAGAFWVEEFEESDDPRHARELAGPASAEPPNTTWTGTIELAIAGDVPFSTVASVMYSAGRAEWSAYSFVVRDGEGLATLDVRPPKFGAHPKITLRLGEGESCVSPTLWLRDGTLRYRAEIVRRTAEPYGWEKATTHDEMFPQCFDIARPHTSTSLERLAKDMRRAQWEHPPCGRVEISIGEEVPWSEVASVFAAVQFTHDLGEVTLQILGPKSEEPDEPCARTDR